MTHIKTVTEPKLYVKYLLKILFEMYSVICIEWTKNWSVIEDGIRTECLGHAVRTLAYRLSQRLFGFNKKKKKHLVWNSCVFLLFLGYWPLGVVWCNVYVTCDVLACSASIMHMCFISIGRYLYIFHQLNVNLQKKQFSCWFMIAQPKQEYFQCVIWRRSILYS